MPATSCSGARWPSRCSTATSTPTPRSAAGSATRPASPLGLADPGIAQIFDYGEQADRAYLVMELVHGEPLSTILVRNGPLGAEVTLDVLHQTAKALHAAHSSGVIHRDIKPGNLLVTHEGTIKVTDFGIARAMEAAPVTQTGTVLGTAQYVSPEQAQGLPLTPSTDLYSLGVVAYECLSGRAPFHGDSAVAIALRHLGEQPMRRWASTCPPRCASSWRRCWPKIPRIGPAPRGSWPIARTCCASRCRPAAPTSAR
ncbi:serine/threonine-protein kinase [Nonomuraea ferruginea]